MVKDGKTFKVQVKDQKAKVEGELQGERVQCEISKADPTLRCEKK